MSFIHIETIGPITGNGTSSSALITGTNGDDDITLIARDGSYPGVTGNSLVPGKQDFTVSVNQGPNILFLDTPQVYLDGLSGSDKFDVRSPSPSGVAWDTQVAVNGGPSAAVIRWSSRRPWPAP